MCIQTIVSSTFSLFVVTEADVMTGLGEGVPGKVEPAVAGQELVGEVVATYCTRGLERCVHSRD